MHALRCSTHHNDWLLQTEKIIAIFMTCRCIPIGVRSTFWEHIHGEGHKKSLSCAENSLALSVPGSFSRNLIKTKERTSLQVNAQTIWPGRFPQNPRQPQGDHHAHHTDTTVTWWPCEGQVPRAGPPKNTDAPRPLPFSWIQAKNTTSAFAYICATTMAMHPPFRPLFL